MKKTLVSAILAGTMVFSLTAFQAAGAQTQSEPAQETAAVITAEIQSEAEPDAEQSGSSTARKLLGAVSNLLGAVREQRHRMNEGGQAAEAGTEAAETETQAAEEVETETKAAETDTQAAETETEAAETEMEYVFADWSEDSAALDALIDYVETVTDPSSADFIPEADRIAVFDMDGTVYQELAPTYLDTWMFTWRALDDPKYEAEEETAALANEIRACLDKGEDTPSATQARADVFAGLTTQEYTDLINQFLLQDAWGFEGMTYAEAFYQPMIEVVDYLNENNFKVYLVSGSDRSMCRALIEGVLDIAPEHVIGSDIRLEATGQGEEAGKDYTLQEDDVVVRTNESLIKNVKTNKVYQIAQEIGRQPVLCFGNSSGDTSMALYTTRNNKYSSKAFFLVADDDVRDWADAQAAEEIRKTWEDYGFQVISMKEDFRTIYGDDVTRLAVRPQIPYEEPETETEAVTEAAETETETVTEAAEIETVTEAAETEAETVTEAAETEAVTEAAETETETAAEAAETEAVTEAETEAVTEAAEAETEAVTEAAEPKTEASTAEEAGTEAETVPSEPEPAPETEELDIETLERMRESENAEKETGAEADAPAGEAETELIDGKLYYEIQEGDNLWQVAEKLLGAGGRFQEIAQANDLEEPYDLMPGEKLLIPAA